VEAGSSDGSWGMTGVYSADTMRDLTKNFEIKSEISGSRRRARMLKYGR